ncbi:DUF2975 domain-containing protein [Flavobacterium subsaxonicum]|uniref:DUF2975 domain-containing protein n=1 Tax=Flavobacterium subsaxonicum WB 4.1-42 = DSM 21790 TaxID=1121898 RepID=A0A0A2MEN3_9FLAO|nr:DUF2975 domain-containing protein [Flavobacterium subsaxonicum]KGO91137.1 hypothetical protein Q766_19430 [Flavobacterium subsaxonicum WB 4.1-42 = DSM 21790]
MKYHLNIILLALRAAIVLVFGMVAFYALNIYDSILNPNAETVVDSYLPQFKIPQFIIPPAWGTPVFLSLYLLLLIYLIFKLLELHKSLANLKNGHVFYERQSAEFKSAGSGIIIFAKCQYLLFCTLGTLVYANIAIFLTELPWFFALYLIGKFVLLLHYMAQKGEFLREENELTV